MTNFLIHTVREFETFNNSKNVNFYSPIFEKSFEFMASSEATFDRLIFTLQKFTVHLTRSAKLLKIDQPTTDLNWIWNFILNTSILRNILEYSDLELENVSNFSI